MLSFLSVLFFSLQIVWKTTLLLEMPLPITWQTRDHWTSTDIPLNTGCLCAEMVEQRKMGELQGSLGAIGNRNADSASALLSTQQLCSYLEWCCSALCAESIRGHCHDLSKNKAEQEFFVCICVHMWLYLRTNSVAKSGVPHSLWSYNEMKHRYEEVITLIHVSCL